MCKRKKMHRSNKTNSIGMSYLVALAFSFFNRAIDNLSKRMIRDIPKNKKMSFSIVKYLDIKTKTMYTCHVEYSTVIFSTHNLKKCSISSYLTACAGIANRRKTLILGIFKVFAFLKLKNVSRRFAVIGYRYRGRSSR